MAAALTLVLIFLSPRSARKICCGDGRRDAVPVLKGAAPAADVCLRHIDGRLFFLRAARSNPPAHPGLEPVADPQLVLIHMLALCAVTVGNFGGSLRQK